MKRTSNAVSRLIAAGVSLGVVAAVALPVVSSALPVQAHAATADSANSQFCTGLSAKATATMSKMSELSAKLSQAWSTQDQKLAGDWQNVDQKVATDRSQADTTRATDFTKLEAKATTDSQKQAVQTYETAVKNAVTTRRAAYDAARQAYRSGVQSALTARRSTITAQEQTFTAVVTSAFQTAESQCSAGTTSSATIRQNLIAALKTARETYQGDRKDDSTVGSQVKQLAQTRDTAFTQADTAFQTTLNTARTALKTAFGSSSSKV